MAGTEQSNLETGDLEKAREHMSTALAALSSLGVLVAAGARRDPLDQPEIRLVPTVNGYKTVYLHGPGDTCYVYEDPPGICRPCDGREILPSV
jgi:hypothetical protein